MVAMWLSKGEDYELENLKTTYLGQGAAFTYSILRQKRLHRIPPESLIYEDSQKDFGNKESSDIFTNVQFPKRRLKR